MGALASCNGTYIVLHGKLQYFFEGIDSIMAPDRVSLKVADMVVRSEHDLDGVFRN